MRKFACYLFFVCCCVISCKKPYNPTLIASPSSYLVVEGTINSGPDSTFIKLSRTIPVSSNKIKPETAAIVTVESDNGTSYVLAEKKKGMYAIGPMGLDNAHKYHLRIKTADGKEYVSDMQAVKYNPPIDSVGYTVTGKGIDVYVNTHDPKNGTLYYMWDYNETWRFHAKYFSGYVSSSQDQNNVPDGSDIVSRSNNFIYYCFANDTSSTIVLGNSAKLTQDVIYQNLLTQILSTSEKIELKYSVLVRQYALTKEAYQFWSAIKKITEQLGNIFDAQPSQISGNIHNVKDAAEPVIGYVTVTNVQTKRVFFTREELPNTFITTYPYDCVQDTALYLNPKTGNNDVKTLLVNKPERGVPVSEIPVGGHPVKGYTYSSRLCADCTLRGTVKQPSFWK